MDIITQQKNKGSIKWIILIIIGLVLASYFFDFNVQEAVEDEQTQSNFNYIKNHLVNFYDTYLRQTIDYVWNDVFIELIWNNITDQIESYLATE